MTAPASITATERRDRTHASLHCLVGKHMTPDPTLTFRVDLGLKRRPARKKEGKR